MLNSSSESTLVNTKTTPPKSQANSIDVKQRVNLDNCEKIASKIASGLRIHFTTAYILAQRGISEVEDAKAFLSPTLRHHLPNPATLLNAESAVDLIIESIKKKKYITLFSDFDVDGITSASQIWHVLGNAGARLRHYVPNRMTEGYGLSLGAVEKLQEEKTDLLITLDCGITSINEVRRAKELGLEVIIVDHHELSAETPEADIIVNPMQEDCAFHGHKLATAGIAWLLSILLIKKIREDEFFIPFHDKLPHSKELLDLAAIGTICDMVPLVGVNRLIASRGIDSIRTTPRLGIKALQEVANLPQGNRFSCSHISFGIGPRLNAAGRLKDAGIGFKLLTSDSSSDTKSVAHTIHKLNQERKTLEEHARDICITQVEELHQESSTQPSAYALYDDSFHVGIIGIAAQRIVEKVQRPVAVMGPSESSIKGKDTIVVKGSVRSIREFHVAKALSKLSSILISHGGHAEAGGFSILPENIDIFRKSFNELALQEFSTNPPQREILVDCNIDFKDINIQLVQEIQSLAPFGVGNPSPLFLSRKVEIEHLQLIGENHVKMQLKQNDTIRNAIAWRMRGNPLLIRGKVIDLVFALELNTYKGITSVQLIAKEILEPSS